MDILTKLIKEAGMFGSSACRNGIHRWESEGGRTCPKYEGANCSQTVYVCQDCGTYDYGTKGGPAHHECFNLCRRDFADDIAEGIMYAEEVAKATELAITSKIIYTNTKVCYNYSIPNNKRKDQNVFNKF